MSSHVCSLRDPRMFICPLSEILEQQSRHHENTKSCSRKFVARRFNTSNVPSLPQSEVRGERCMTFRVKIAKIDTIWIRPVFDCCAFWTETFSLTFQWRSSDRFIALDASRPWIIYWILQALDLLDRLPAGGMIKRVIGTIASCQVYKRHCSSACH